MHHRSWTRDGAHDPGRAWALLHLWRCACVCVCVCVCVCLIEKKRKLWEGEKGRKGNYAVCACARVSVFSSSLTLYFPSLSPPLHRQAAWSGTTSRRDNSSMQRATSVSKCAHHIQLCKNTCPTHWLSTSASEETQNKSFSSEPKMEVKTRRPSFTRMIKKKKVNFSF